MNTNTKKKTTLPGGFPFGGLEGIRTLDPHNANVVRSQLRYKPKYLPLDYSPAKKDCQGF